jgi:hypothetical protein
VKDEVEEFGDDFHGYPCSMAMRALVLHKMSDRATLLVNRCLGKRGTAESEAEQKPKGFVYGQVHVHGGGYVEATRRF